MVLTDGPAMSSDQLAHDASAGRARSKKRDFTTPPEDNVGQAHRSHWRRAGRESGGPTAAPNQGRFAGPSISLVQPAHNREKAEVDASRRRKKSAPLGDSQRSTSMGLGRVELPTSRLSGVRSNHLSYRPLPKRGT